MGKRKTKNSEHTSGSEPGDNRLPARGRGKALKLGEIYCSFMIISLRVCILHKMYVFRHTIIHDVIIFFSLWDRVLQWILSACMDEVISTT